MYDARLNKYRDKELSSVKGWAEGHGFTTGVDPKMPFVTVGRSNADYITDGVDDQVQINEAINFMYDNHGGGVVYLKDLGHYSISASVLLRNDIGLRGNNKQETYIIVAEDPSNPGYLYDINGIEVSRHGAGVLRTKTGYGKISSSGTTVTGAGSQFIRQMSLTGESTIIADGQTKTVVSITSDTELTIDSAFTTSLSNENYQVTARKRTANGCSIRDLWVIASSYGSFTHPADLHIYGHTGNALWGCMDLLHISECNFAGRNSGVAWQPYCLGGGGFMGYISSSTVSGYVGVNVGGQYDSWITDSFISGLKAGVGNYDGATELRVSDNHINAVGHCIYSLGGSRVRATGNVFENPQSTAVVLYACNTSQITGNKFYQTKTCEVGTGDVLSIYAGDACTVTGNIFTVINPNSFRSIVSYDGVDGLAITGNTFYYSNDFGYRGDVADKSIKDINSVASVNVSIMGNTYKNVQTSASETITRVGINTSRSKYQLGIASQEIDSPVCEPAWLLVNKRVTTSGTSVTSTDTDAPFSGLVVGDFIEVVHGRAPDPDIHLYGTARKIVTKTDDNNIVLDAVAVAYTDADGIHDKFYTQKTSYRTKVLTSGSSTTVTSETAGDASFRDIVTGSEITANSLTRTVVAKASDDSITVDTAVDWSSGYEFTYKNPFMNMGGFETGVNGELRIPDGITEPPAIAGNAQLYVDTADGDLKVKFGDGTVKTIVTDT